MVDGETRWRLETFREACTHEARALTALDDPSLHDILEKMAVLCAAIDTALGRLATPEPEHAG